MGTTTPAGNLHVYGDIDGSTSLRLENQNTGTSAFTQFTSNVAGGGYWIYNFGSGYTTSGRFITDSTLIDANGAGGLGLSANSAAPIRFYTNGNNERMIINSSGNVGIGTTSPLYKLDVWGRGTFTTTGATNAFVQVSSTGTGDAFTNPVVSSSGGDAYTKYTVAGIRNWVVGVDNSDNDSFKIGGTAIGSDDKLTITTAGNVGIGTTSPTSRLSLGDTSVTNTASLVDLNVNGRNLVLTPSDPTLFGGQIGMTTAHALSFITSDTERLTISSGGNVGIGTTSPDNLLDIFGGSVHISNGSGDVPPDLSNLTGLALTNNGSSNEFQALRIVTDTDSSDIEAMTVTKRR